MTRSNVTQPTVSLNGNHQRGGARDLSRASFVSHLTAKSGELETLFQRIVSADPSPEDHDALTKLVYGVAIGACKHDMLNLAEAAGSLSEQLISIQDIRQLDQDLLGHLQKGKELLAQVLKNELESSAESMLSVDDELGEPLIFLLNAQDDQAAQLIELLRPARYRIECFSNIDSLIEHALTNVPTLVLLDESGYGDKDGLLSTVERLESRLPSLPLLVVMTSSEDSDTMQAAYQAGVNRYLIKPQTGHQLVRRLDLLIGRSPNAAYRVLLVEPDDGGNGYAEYLRQAGMRVVSESDPLKAFSLIDVLVPDVLILSIADGKRGCGKLVDLVRRDKVFADLPMLFLKSGEGEFLPDSETFDVDNDRVMQKPLDKVYLVAAVVARARQFRASKQVASSLRRIAYESEREQRALDQHAIVSIADVAGDIIYANDLFCRISGYQRQELIGRNHRMIKSGQHSAEFYHELWDTISSGRVWQGIICNQAKDGHLYWVNSTIVPYLDERGRPYQYVSIRTDVTRLKELEEQALQAAERARQSQVFANIGTWDWNIQTNELFWSERIAPLFGYETGKLETTYENFMQAVHPDDREKVVHAIENCIENHAVYEIEHRVVWPDGQVRWVKEQGDVTRDEEGKPLHMLGVVRDIHARKSAEQSLAIFRRLFDSSDRGIYVTDAKGVFIYCNRAFEQLAGYSDSEIIGLHYSRFFTDEDAGKTVRRINASIKQGKGWFGKIPLRCSDGSLIVTQSNIGLINDEGGKLQYLFNILSDYRPELRRQAQLHEAKEVAERASEAKSLFLSSMSHELRTPMNAILGFAQILEYDQGMSEEQQDSVQEILDAGHHLLALINDVLDLSKIESGRVELKFTEVELMPLVDECFGLLNAPAEKNNLVLTQSGCEGLSLQSDRTRLKQVILNLLSNAVKYNVPGGRVELQAQKTSHGTVLISVKDTGRGISERDMEKLFVPFSRLSAERGDIEGSGIGLTITRRILQVMDSDVHVSSRPGEGSVFWFELQTDPAQLNLIQHRTNHDAESDEPHAWSTSGALLYIEDQAEDVKLLKQALAPYYGIDLMIANNVADGVDMARKYKPQLILLNLDLTKVRTESSVRLLSAVREPASTPVIGICSEPDQWKTQLQSIGLAGVLGRPMQLGRLVNMVSSVFGFALIDESDGA